MHILPAHRLSCSIHASTHDFSCWTPVDSQQWLRTSAPRGALQMAADCGGVTSGEERPDGPIRGPGGWEKLHALRMQACMCAGFQACMFGSIQV